jgi:hypothetical protein
VETKFGQTATLVASALTRVRHGIRAQHAKAIAAAQFCADDIAIRAERFAQCQDLNLDIGRSVSMTVLPAAERKRGLLIDRVAAWTNKGQVKVGLAYGTNYLIDTGREMILDFEATPARWSAEVAATKTMLERAEECFGLKPQRLVATPLTDQG